jgi:hypothetical protein
VNVDSESARRIRAIVESLHEIAYTYEECGMANECDEINAAADQVRRLQSLPDTDDD